MPGENPMLINMLLCDNAIIEKGTEKKTLVGVFNQVKHGKPIHARLYFTVSDMPKACDFQVDVERLPDDLEEQGQKILNVEIKQSRDVQLDKLNSYDFIIPMQLNFPQAGTYEVKLYANSELVGSRSIKCF